MWDPSVVDVIIAQIIVDHGGRGSGCGLEGGSFEGVFDFFDAEEPITSFVCLVVVAIVVVVDVGNVPKSLPAGMQAWILGFLPTL